MHIRYTFRNICLVLLLLLTVLPYAGAYGIPSKKIVVLKTRMENDIGIANADRIITGWLTDSITQTKRDFVVVSEEQAEELARLRLPSKVDEMTPSVARSLMKSIGATHALGAEVFIWNKKYGITLRMVELSNRTDIRIERGWANSVNEIPDKIEDLTYSLFGIPHSSVKHETSEGPTTENHRGVSPKVEALLRKHPDMVYVPGGTFLMGNDNDSDADNIPLSPARREGVSRFVLLAAEKPEHTAYVAPFLVDKYEVTNAEYKKFDAGHNFPAEKANCPVTGISWHDARAYAEWAGKRLPTEQEWEKAARGDDGRKWPWGNIFRRGYCNLGTEPARVGSFENDRSPYGVYDMAGNVQEWTSSDFTPYPGNNAGEISFDPSRKVVRGSYYGGNDFLARCSMRFCALPGVRGKNPETENYKYIGFRCAMDAD